MKTTLKVIITLLVMTGYSFAQTYEPAQVGFRYKYSGGPVFLDQHPDFRQDTSFIITWHWYSGKKMSEVLGLNAVHTPSEVANGSGGLRYLDPERDSLPRNVNLIVNVPYLGWHWHGFIIPSGRAIHYDPSLQLNTAPENFTPRPYDTTRPIFGFRNRLGYTPPDPGNPNYNRLIIENTDANRNKVILSEPYTCDYLSSSYQPGIDTIRNIYNKPPGVALTRTDKLITEEYAGVNFYLSINLRRLNSTDNEVSPDTVLILKMPFVNVADGNGNRITGAIKFDSLPNRLSSDTFALPNNRGTARKLVGRDPGDTLFVITKGMLPRGDAPDKDITISAHFRCNNNLLRYNYVLKGFNPSEVEDKNTIDSLKFEAYYKGNSSIAIDWIRIETRPARELWRGYFDSTIIKKVQETIDSLTTPKFTSRGIKLFRFFDMDEPSPLFYSSLRYLRKLIGPIYTHEVGPPTMRYKHYLNYYDKWNGNGKIGSLCHMPWLIPGYNSGFNDSIWKFGGWITRLLPPFELTDAQRANYLATSGYETDFNNREYSVNHKWVTDTGDSVFVTYEDMNNISFFDRLKIATTNYGNWGYGTLLNQGMQEYDVVANPKTTACLFDTLNWWGQVNLDGRYHVGSPDGWLQKNDGYRHLTGEELRFFINSFLLYGAKGIAIDGEAIDYNWGNLPINLHHGQDSVNKWGMNNLPALEFLLKDSIGGDYINYTDGTDPLRNRFLGDSISHYLGVPKDSIYVGRKSQRLELFKTYTFVRRNEREIMNMRFEAGLTKGLRRYYLQNPKYGADTLLYSFIDKNRLIRTRPLGRMFNEGPFYENDTRDPIHHNRVDSCFYYVTLLSDKTDSSMTKSFYLGVQNKRTGPHIFNPDGATMRDSVRFYSTADVDELYLRDRDSGAAFNWAKLGCREITVPINYTKSPKADAGTILRIEEMGLRDSVYQSNYWRQPDYTHIIDTTLERDGNLILRLLPGEGKILKVTPEYFNSGPGPDTCYGCEAIKRHVAMALSPARCEGGFNLWNLTINNQSDCDYSDLNVAIRSRSRDASNLYIDTSATGFRVATESNGGERYWNLSGELAANETINIPFSISSNFTIEYEVLWGRYVNGQLIECDLSFISAHSVESDCDRMQADIKDTTLTCQCGTAKVIHVWIPDSLLCVSELVFNREVNGAPVSDTLTAVPDSGYTFTFCPWANWRASVTLLTQTGVRCTKEFTSPICQCDTIRITSIWDRIGVNCTGFNFDFRKISNCTNTYDVAEILPNGILNIVKSNVQISDSGIVEEWLPRDEHLFRKFIIIARNKDCAPPCFSDTIKITPTHWASPAMIETKAVFIEDSIPCMAEIISTRSDMLPIHVFGITVFDGREPYELLHSEMRNPNNDPPIDLRIPGGYPITTLVFPCDSTLKLTVKYWDADTNCVAINDIDTTSGAGDNREYLESLVAVPNPASEEITLDYEMKKGADVELEITDSQGNTKRKSIKAYRGKGKHNLTFQLNGLQSGSYYAIIRAEGESIATRIVIIK